MGTDFSVGLRLLRQVRGSSSIDGWDRLGRNNGLAHPGADMGLEAGDDRPRSGSFLFPDCRTASMNAILSVGITTVLLAASPVQQPILRQSDVVFMYQSDRATYAEYGATVVAWGGRPTRASRTEAEGLKFLGSVGMVTEFSRYYERFPDSYENGLCRDVQGQPLAVPWLTDHRHKEIPYWWCCTNQPQFRTYIRERVIETIQAGADGLHIDDHLGTAGGLWLGSCFCDRCLSGFREYLATLPKQRLEELAVSDPEEFDYRQVVLQWQAADVSAERKPPQHPFWHEWTVFQCRSAADFMQELRELAAETAGHSVPVAANAGLLWPRHLGDYRSLDLFSAETDHHAPARRLSDAPLMAYRLADAVGRPYASTASGGDWAFVKEHELDGLVRGWIALSYAAGHRLMAPHRQWCYTPQKGTHWYQGPAERYAPLYRFVRENADLFDGYEAHADLTVVLPHRSFVADPNRWFRLFEQLAAENFAYRIALAGDEIVDHPLPAALANSPTPCWIPERNGFLPDDQRRVEELCTTRSILQNIDVVRNQVEPAVRVRTSQPVRVLPRTRPGSAVVHLLNFDYDSDQDEIRTLRDVQVTLKLAALGVPDARECKIVSPSQPSRLLPLEGHQVVLSDLDLWTILLVR